MLTNSQSSQLENNFPLFSEKEGLLREMGASPENKRLSQRKKLSQRIGVRGSQREIGFLEKKGFLRGSVVFSQRKSGNLREKRFSQKKWCAFSESAAFSKK